MPSLMRYTDRGSIGQGDDISLEGVNNIWTRLLLSSDTKKQSSQLNKVASVPENIRSQVLLVGSGGGKRYEGINLFGSTGVEIISNLGILMESPMIGSRGVIKMRSLYGDISGKMLFSEYLDYLLVGGRVHSISGRRGIIVGLAGLLLEAPEGKISINGYLLSSNNMSLNSKSLEIKDYVLASYYKEDRVLKGIKILGSYGSLLNRGYGKGIGQGFIDSVPLLSGTRDLFQSRSITDLGPAMKLGGEILDIFTSGDSLGELLRGQLGVTDNYLPKGISYVKEKRLLEFQEEVGYSSRLIRE